MKISKIPGLGRFGVFIDDIDLKTITQDQWMEIGRIHLESLVTIIRGNELDYATYYDLIMKWGPSRWNRPINFYLKYGKPMRELVLHNEIDAKDRNDIRLSRLWQIDKRRPGMIRVTPKKFPNGEPMGIFGDGELLWHSNECGDTAFTPGVALMGWESMKGSCTGFCTSTDWYEKQSESFRSELDEMIVVHNYQEGKLSPIVIDEQEHSYKNNMCPIPDSQVPLVIQSPGGIRGLHLGINTADKIVGMSKEDSVKLFDKIRKEMFTEEYTYQYWYKQDRGEICLFDNSITLHNRGLEGESAPKRIGLRIQYDFDKLTGESYQPFYQQQYNDHRNERLDLLSKAVEGLEIKFE